MNALVAPRAKQIRRSFDCFVQASIGMGLSIRAYARHRAVSHVAVLRAIKQGRVPVEPDGTIDPAKADASWKRSTDPGRARAKPKASAEKLRPVGEAALAAACRQHRSLHCRAD